MKTILLPTDFSETAHNAFHFALHLADELDGKLILLHVYPDNPIVRDFALPPIIDLLNADKVEDAFAHFEQYEKEARTHLGKEVEVELRIEQGHADQVIVQLTQKPEIDLVVMGTQGIDSEDGKIFGSLTTHVINDAACPVLAIPEAAKYQGINHIMYATNYQQEDLARIQQLIFVADTFDANISVTHIHTGPEKWYKMEYRFFEALYEQRHKWHMLGFYNFTHDDVVDGLEKFIRETKVDMVAMLTHHRDLLGNVVSPSVTQEMSLFTYTPLLVFHE